MPDTPQLQAHFGQSRKAKPGCGFPVAHLMFVVDAATGLLFKAFAAPLHSHDMGLVRRAHPALKRGDVMVADRGFSSFAHMAILLMRSTRDFPGTSEADRRLPAGREHIPPTQKRAPRGMPRSRWLYANATFDQVVEYFKPQSRPEWMSAREYARHFLGRFGYAKPVTV